MSADNNREAVHEDPVWRDRANFIIAARINDGGDIKTEQLWARKEDQGRFEICCIPFFIYDLALGDVAETDTDYLVRRVVRPSGRFVFRVWFGESFHPRDEIADGLKAFGSLIEWSSLNLLAVDAADEGKAQQVVDFLAEHERAGNFAYEAGRSLSTTEDPRFRGQHNQAGLEFGHGAGARLVVTLVRWSPLSARSRSRRARTGSGTLVRACGAWRCPCS